MKVAEIDLKGQGEHLTVDVCCIAPTLGWKDVDLQPVQYLTPPVDGIQDFILHFVEPEENAPNAVELFNFSLPIHCPYWFQGVRIRTADNEVLVTLRNPVKRAKPVGDDMFWITSFGTRKDQLIMEVTYPGGPNAQHTYQLSWNGIIQNSNPAQVTLELSHNNNSDSDRVLLPDILHFDLSTLEGFPTTQMIIHIKGACNDEVLFYNPPPDVHHTIVKNSGVSALGKMTLT